MNPLIEMYDKMLADPNTYMLMEDPEFTAETKAMVQAATPEQHEEFDEYVKKDLQAQLNNLVPPGEHDE